MEVRSKLGYCPQHDALLDLLTVREHLELFGRIKGVPEKVRHHTLVWFVGGLALVMQDYRPWDKPQRLSGMISLSE
jgi:ABC-type multidrug transport system ATPase subunit